MRAAAPRMAVDADGTPAGVVSRGTSREAAVASPRPKRMAADSLRGAAVRNAPSVALSRCDVRVERCDSDLNP